MNSTAWINTKIHTYELWHTIWQYSSWWWIYVLHFMTCEFKYEFMYLKYIVNNIQFHDHEFKCYISMISWPINSKRNSCIQKMSLLMWQLALKQIRLPGQNPCHILSSLTTICKLKLAVYVLVCMVHYFHLGILYYKFKFLCIFAFANTYFENVFAKAQILYFRAYIHIWTARQWPEVYDLCHTFLHVAWVKQHTAMRELPAFRVQFWPDSRDSDLENSHLLL